MKKKGVEISLNTMIVAIICLIVLFIVIAIFTGSMKDIADKFRKGTDSAGKESTKTFESIGIFGDQKSTDQKSTPPKP